MGPRLTSAFAVAVLCATASTSAQPFPSQARGLGADVAYQSGGIGHINLFNGALSVPISVGQRYLAPDGNEHGLYPELHPGYGDQTDVHYSNDGSYLRMRLTSSSAECHPVAGTSPTCQVIEAPGGTAQEFHEFGTAAEPAWRLTRVRDRFGNRVDLTYTATTWRLEDSHGRTQIIRFEGPSGEYQRISSVELTKFGGPGEVRLPPGLPHRPHGLRRRAHLPGGRHAVPDRSHQRRHRHGGGRHGGHARQMTDAAGIPVAVHAYYPFGLEATSPGQTPFDKKFTGHERDENGPDSAGDLDYMHARYCSPTLGRFLSPDPIGGNPANPQSWNRYSYVLNNPINFLDPFGLQTATFNDEIYVFDVDPLRELYGDADLPWIVIRAFYEDQLPAGVAFDPALAQRVVPPLAGPCSDPTCQALGVIGQHATGVNVMEAGVVEITTFMITGPLLSGSVAAGGVPRVSGRTSRILLRSKRSLQKFFTKHGDDFGLKGTWSSSRIADASRAIHQHINSPGVRRITGTYRGQRVIHHLDPNTGLNVIEGAGGSFVSGWRLSPEQLQSVVATGRLF